MIAVGSLLWHHIHVSLQQCSLTVLIAWGSRFAHDDISTSVLEGLYTDFCCKVEKELLYFLQVTRRTWHLCQCVKVAPDGCWLQIADFTHNITFNGYNKYFIYSLMIVSCLLLVFFFVKLSAIHP